MSDFKPAPKRFVNIHQFQITHIEGLETVCSDSVDIFDKWKNEFVSLSLAVALAQMFMKGEIPFEQLATMEVVHGMVDMKAIHVFAVDTDKGLILDAGKEYLEGLWGIPAHAFRYLRDDWEMPPFIESVNAVDFIKNAFVPEHWVELFNQSLKDEYNPALYSKAFDTKLDWVDGLYAYPQIAPNK